MAGLPLDPSSQDKSSSAVLNRSQVWSMLHSPAQTNREEEESEDTGSLIWSHSSALTAVRLYGLILAREILDSSGASQNSMMGPVMIDCSTGEKT